LQVILGAAYRGFIHFTNTAGIKTKECWQVDRGDDLPAVWSCEGLGDPSYFYINGVWLCAGITAALIFLYGCYLSRSIFGGIIAISGFFFNHGEVYFSKICNDITKLLTQFYGNTVYPRSVDTSFAGKFRLSIDFGSDFVSLLVSASNNTTLETFMLYCLYYYGFPSHLAIFAICLPYTSAQFNGVVDPKFYSSFEYNCGLSWKIGKYHFPLIS